MLLAQVQKGLAGFVVLLCGSLPALAQTSGQGSIGTAPGTGPTIGEQGTGHFGIQLGYFDVSDSPGNGNPFLDESLTIIEPLLVFDYNVTDRLNIGAKLAYDVVTSASIERLDDHPSSQQSGASGDNYIGGDFSMRYQQTQYWTLGGHAAVSSEYDYFSIGVGLNATQVLKDTDATMSYSLDLFQDTVDIIRFDGVGTEGSDDRTSITANVSWYQILSPTSHGTFGVTLAQQNGFLETPYNSVIVEGTDVNTFNLHNGANGFESKEVLPDSRSRVALYGRVLNSLGKGHAWELGGRLYTDSWGINSVTAEPRYIVSLIDDKLDLRLRYRYYTQTAADAFSSSFLPVGATPGESDLPAERTQDSDLGDFDAHTLGSKWIWTLDGGDTVTFNLDYTMRGDGLDQAFASIAWMWKF